MASTMTAHATPIEDVIVIPTIPMSYDEYLAWCEAEEGNRGEWVDGEVIPFMTTSARHQRIHRFLFGLLVIHRDLRRVGEVFSQTFEMRSRERAAREREGTTPLDGAPRALGGNGLADRRRAPQRRQAGDGDGLVGPVGLEDPIATHADKVDIDVPLVRRLLAAQFPEWAHLPITPAVPQGWDNRTFRLGADLAVRLPSAVGYVPQVEKEHRWLPHLAAHLPLPIPAPLALGEPGASFPWPWSVYRWLAGGVATLPGIDDLTAFAVDLAEFLAALQHVDATGGPPPGLHSAFRGGPLTTYDAETRHTIVALGGAIDGEAATEVWEAALAATYDGRPVWFHGDVAINNLLVDGGRLSAVIDFGCAGVGDPACDTVIAWTMFSGESREAFRNALPLDRATWTRGRGWALWKALITYGDPDPLKSAEAHRVATAVVAEHRAGTLASLRTSSTALTPG